MKQAYTTSRGAEEFAAGPRRGGSQSCPRASSPGAAAPIVQTGPIEVSSSPLRLGENSVWGEFFEGRIDEVRIYNKTLSAAQIQVDMTTAIATTSTCTGNSVWPATAVPGTAADPDTAAVELGLKFRSDVNGGVWGALL